MIHSTALIHPGVQLGVDVEIGPYAVIGWPGEARVPLVRPRGRVVIGDHARISEHVRIQSGIEGVTTLGDHVMIMGGGHVGHDCQLGDWVTTAASVGLGGHTVLEDYVTVGTLANTHQHALIREGTILGAGSFFKGESEDWAVYAGSPAVYKGVNRIGRTRFEQGYYKA